MRSSSDGIDSGTPRAQPTPQPSNSSERPSAQTTSPIPSDKLRAICEKLVRPIPSPRKAAPKPQKSWATLKVGDVVCRKPSTDMGSGVETITPQPKTPEVGSIGVTDTSTPSSTRTVQSCDSQGVTLDDGTRIEEREWKRQWTRVPKRKGSQ
jgi:hypothetical protein